MTSDASGNTVVISLPSGMSEDDYWLVQHGSLNATIVFAVVLSVVLWDYILLIPDEIRLYKTGGAWNKPAPWAFIALRYAVLVPSIAGLFFTAFPTKHCEVASALSWAGAVIVTIGGGMIFCVRVISLWHNSKSITAVVGVMYTFMVASWISVAVQIRVANGPETELFSNCQQVGIPRTSSLSYASSVAFDLVIVTLTLMRIPQRPLLNSTLPIVNVLHRDTLLYFITITIVNITVLTIESLGSSSLRIQLLKPLFIPFSTACTAILASRVFLNLRNTAAVSHYVTENHVADMRGHNVPAVLSRITFADASDRQTESVFLDSQGSLHADSETQSHQWKRDSMIVYAV